MLKETQVTKVYYTKLLDVPAEGVASLESPYGFVETTAKAITVLRVLQSFLPTGQHYSIQVIVYNKVKGCR